MLLKYIENFSLKRTLQSTIFKNYFFLSVYQVVNFAVPLIIVPFLISRIGVANECYNNNAHTPRHQVPNPVLCFCHKVFDRDIIDACRHGSVTGFKRYFVQIFWQQKTTQPIRRRLINRQ